MPNLVLSVNGGTSCDAFSYQISITYTDQAGAITGTNITFNAQDVVGDQSSTVDWFSNFEGGNATISWQFDGVSEPSFSFEINGINPSNSAVDSYLSNGDGAWFKQNLVAWESRAYSLAPSGQYKQFDPSNTTYPVLWGGPDGVGLMQVESPNRSNSDRDFWSWPANIADGLAVLDGKKSAAYQSWNDELGQMQSLTGANPVYPPSIGYAYCYFSYPQNGNDTYADGDWIHYYNGNYFIFFHPADSSGPNRWDIDTMGYVMSVCNAAPL
jgi:hypothetical protein